MKITGAELAAALFLGEPSRALSVSKARATRLMESVLAEQVACDTSSCESSALRESVMRLCRALTPEAIALLEDTPIAALSTDVCMAVATKVRGVRIVLVTSGLLDLISASLEKAQAIDGLPESLKGARPHPMFPDTKAANLAAVWFASLLYRFQEDGHPLPRFGHLVPEDRLDFQEDSVSGAYAWLVFHELGHIALNHQDWYARPLQHELLSPVIEEPTDDQKLKEQDADAFARGCFLPKWQPAAIAWANIAMNHAVCFEPLVSERPDAHPLATNRIASMLARTLQELPSADTTGLTEHLSRHGLAFTRLEKINATALQPGNRPPFAKWTREEIVQNLEVLVPVFEQHGVDLRAVFDESGEVPSR